MVTQQAAATVFAAIADPTRRAILDLLRRHEMSAGELASRFPVSRPAVSRHVRVLREAGLVQERREAQWRRYSLNPAPLAQVDRWIAAYRVFWGARLHDLKRYVEDGERRK
jgi:DNA-binding transcriptional ArsR family regulator